jgi:uncharacterized protein (TIGR02145 family)
MKKIFLSVLILLSVCVTVSAQKLSYQAVVRDSHNRLVVNTNVNVAVTITYGTGTYTESLSGMTNANGLMSLEIGGASGFGSIDWRDAWIKTVITIPGDGTVEDMVQVTAIPLALYANYAADISPDAPTITAIYAHLGDTLGHYPTTDVLKDTAAAIRADMAAAQVNSDWNATSGVEEILNKPDLSVYATNAHLNDTLGHYHTTDILKDTAAAIRNSIGNGTLTITYGTEMPVTFTANQKTDTSITIPAPAAPNHGEITIKKNNTDIVNGTFNVDQSNDQIINITVPTCDSLYDCDLIKDILDRLNTLEHLTDSLANELDKLRPALTVTASQDTVTVCLGYSLPVTYTATFHNCSSSDYTISWKVNGTDSSNVTTPTFTFNAETAGKYEVLCVATRSDNTFVTDTVTTTVIVDSAIPSFTASVSNLTVNLSDIENTVTIQWDTDSLPVPFSGTSATHTYAVADTVTITATNKGGCTISQELVLKAVAPTVTTDSIPAGTITATTATAYGTVTFDGGVPETKRGVVYSTSNTNLKLGADGVDSVTSGTGMGSFACNLKRLVPCTQYYVRAFAINEVDTAYGEVKEFTTPSFTCGNTLTDIDGNEYETLLLGSQCWMKQNLRVSHYANGDTILLSTSTVGTTSPYRYEPDSNLTTCGYLYNWYAAMGGSSSSASNPSNVQGVCPKGWHLPSDAEWTQLTDFVSSYNNGIYVCGNDPANIGKSMASQQGWPVIPGEGCNIGNTIATNNSTQFSIPSAGTWDCGGGIGTSGIGYTNNGHAIFLSATENDDPTYSVYCREFYYMESVAEKTAPHKTFGRSVRCVLDCATGHTYLPTVSTVKITNTGGTLSMAANVDADGGAEVTARGVCWSTSQHPTTSSDHTADSGTGTGEFTVTGSLTPGATYYVRAYATNSEGTAYGAEVSFVMPNLPTVTTTAATDVTASTATTGGDVTADGGASVTARGVCWSTSPNPTIADSHTSDGSGTGGFTSNITGLNATTTYYVRAYATNAGGTSYGSQVSFTTTDVLPKVTTSAVSNISGTTDITATCGGNVTDMGLDDVTARGVCWSTSENPTISDSHTTDGSGLGSFTSDITSLTAGNTYYVRAYATNSAGTAYGNQVNFTVPLIDGKSCPGTPTVTDHEGNVYATVLIGTQCWMRENLRTTTSPKTGTYLVNTEHKTTVNRSSYYGSKVAHWYMNDSTTYAPKGYGLLYNWCAAMDTANPTNYVEVPTPSNSGNNTAFGITVTSNHRGICPAGWHLPSYSEWNTLRNNYSPDDLLASGNDWASSHSNATGFTALPAGYFGNGYASFQGAGTGNKTYFWSCTGGTDRAQALLLQNNQKNLSLTDKNYGMSVRCIKD